jgi:dolichol-phosphate mannosyltransferase
LEQAVAPGDIDLSIIAPAYNEEGNMGPLIERIHEIFSPLAADEGLTFEALIVDDCSTDQTRQRLLELSEKYPWVRTISITPNSGQSAAMYAGFSNARGRVLGTVDADMQNDPAEIARLMKMLGPDVDMVNGWRKDRQDKNKGLRKFQSRFANGLRNWFLQDHIQDSACGLKVYKRECIVGLTLFKGMHRFFPALVMMRGYKVIEVPVSHYERRSGESKYLTGSRAKVAFWDMLAVRWMQKRAIRFSEKELKPAVAGDRKQ